VNEARDWRQGTFFGSILASEKTAAAAGQIGELRRDPMAMLPFCGYNMADYWAHWLGLGDREGTELPRIFYVNWFRKDENGRMMWPGFGENSRVLKWVFERCEGTGLAVETPIGNLPAIDALDFDDADVDETTMAELLRVDVDGWLQEIPLIEEYYDRFGDHLPAALREEVKQLRQRLEQAKPAAA
jgi:phosphoenolpyruvate carboxykinase (GTP)